MRGAIVLKAGAMKRKPDPELSRDEQLDLPDFPELDELLGDLPDLPSLDFTFPELDAGLPDLPGLGFDLEALDKLLDLEPGKGRSFCGPLKKRVRATWGTLARARGNQNRFAVRKPALASPAKLPAMAEAAGASFMAAKAPDRRRKRARRAHSLLCRETTPAAESA